MIHTHNGGEQHEHGSFGPHHHGAGRFEQTAEIWSAHRLTGPSTVIPTEQGDPLRRPDRYAWEREAPLPLKPDPVPAFSYARAQEVHDALTCAYDTYAAGSAWGGNERRTGDRRSEDRDLLAKIQRVEEARAAWQARGRTSWEATDKGSLARLLDPSEVQAERDGYRAEES